MNSLSSQSQALQCVQYLQRHSFSGSHSTVPTPQSACRLTFCNGLCCCEDQACPSFSSNKSRQQTTQESSETGNITHFIRSETKCAAVPSSYFFLFVSICSLCLLKEPYTKQGVINEQPPLVAH